jgi:hypothetical protein
MVKRALLRSSDKAFLALQLTSLVEQDSCPGVRELGFVLSVVVSAELQFVVTVIRDEHADEHVGAGAASIAAIGRCENERFHVTPPWLVRSLRADALCNATCL